MLASVSQLAKISRNIRTISRIPGTINWNKNQLPKLNQNLRTFFSVSKERESVINEFFGKRKIADIKNSPLGIQDIPKFKDYKEAVDAYFESLPTTHPACNMKVIADEAENQDYKLVKPYQYFDTTWDSAYNETILHPLLEYLDEEKYLKMKQSIKPVTYHHFSDSLAFPFGLIGMRLERDQSSVMCYISFTNQTMIIVYATSKDSEYSDLGHFVEVPTGQYVYKIPAKWIAVFQDVLWPNMNYANIKGEPDYSLEEKKFLDEMIEQNITEVDDQGNVIERKVTQVLERIISEANPHLPRDENGDLEFSEHYENPLTSLLNDLDRGEYVDPIRFKDAGLTQEEFLEIFKPYEYKDQNRDFLKEYVNPQLGALSFTERSHVDMKLDDVAIGINQGKIARQEAVDILREYVGTGQMSANVLDELSGSLKAVESGLGVVKPKKQYKVLNEFEYEDERMEEEEVMTQEMEDMLARSLSEFREIKDEAKSASAYRELEQEKEQGIEGELPFDDDDDEDDVQRYFRKTRQ